jgi:hypothetical protein
MRAVAVAADMVGHPEKPAGPWGVPAPSGDAPSGSKPTSCETQWVADLADVGESVTIACQNLATNLFSPVTVDCRQR